jgi:hypothetical protein
LTKLTTKEENIMANTGSETIGAAGDKSKMTLFKDDRAEDMGAIVVSALVIATVMVLTMNKPTPQAPAPAAAPAAVTAAPAATPSAPAEPAKK